MASIGTVLQKGHSSYQKYDLTQMTPNINNGITTILLFFWSTTNTLLKKHTPAIRHRRVKRISLWSGKNLTLKSHDHESGSYNKFKNFLLKITQFSCPWQINFGHFLLLHKVCLLWGTIFCGCHICLFQVEYLSCAIFIRCHYFQMALKCLNFVVCSDGCQTVIIYCFISSLKRY